MTTSVESIYIISTYTDISCLTPLPQDADVVHTEDRVDPVADLDIIHHELRLKDIERVTKHLDSVSAIKGRAPNKDEKEQIEISQKVLACLEGEQDVRCAPDAGGVLVMQILIIYKFRHCRLIPERHFSSTPTDLCAQICSEFRKLTLCRCSC